MGDTGARADWLDVARAMAIVLVALFHSALLLMQEHLTSPVWATINSAFVTFRMPLFFLASGLLAGSAIRRSWGGLWNTRLALLVWVLAIWSIIRFLFFTAVPLDSRLYESDPRGLLLAFVLPSTGLWFLHALAVFLVVAKLAQPLPVWIQLTTAAVLSVLFFSVLHLDSLSWDGMGKYLIFFLAGLYGRSALTRFTAQPRPAIGILAVLAFGVAGLSVELLDLASVPGVLLAVSCLAILVGVTWARILSDTRLVGPLRYLGRRTLPIYVMHVLVVAGLCAALGAADLDLGLGVTLALPVIVCAAAITVSLLVHSLAVRTPLVYLYRAPSFLLLPRVRAS
ncbi:Inner membrane protein YcfT [Clavibacter michiganensis]|uniref:Inner membrane protein YcfT n=1 Tax=Clavibacter michiganensis TaxID=28447 RepID=A0A251XUP1_9MICO|nr:Inner membrane protein YcfT [Clavibacter michiganensis]